MRLGFTGTRTLPADMSAIEDYVADRIVRFNEFTSGACVGFDAWVARYLLRVRPEATHRLVVPANRSQVDIDLYHEFITHTGGWVVIEFMPDGTTYKQRNARILDHADELLGVCDYPERHGKSARSGSWQTVRLARDRRLTLDTYTIHEDAEVLGG